MTSAHAMCGFYRLQYIHYDEYIAAGWCCRGNLACAGAGGPTCTHSNLNRHWRAGSLRMPPGSCAGDAPGQYLAAFDGSAQSQSGAGASGWAEHFLPADRASCTGVDPAGCTAGASSTRNDAAACPATGTRLPLPAVQPQFGPILNLRQPAMNT